MIGQANSKNKKNSILEMNQELERFMDYLGKLTTHLIIIINYTFMRTLYKNHQNIKTKSCFLS